MTPIDRFRRLSGYVLAMLFLAAAPAFALAQDASPAAGTPAHPVHIHEGTCSELTPAPLYPLTDITNPDTSDATGVVETSVTTIDASFDELVAGGLAINAHESAENIGNYIACGEITGAVVSGESGDTIAIPLRQLNDSGYAGIAVLTAADAQTTVTVYLAQGLIDGCEATAAADDMAGMDHGAMGDGVQVEITGFAYNPGTITIQAGESVTWTNMDAAPHTVTAQDRDALQSGTLNQGDTFTQTFDTPGTYEYFCEFHPNMMGVVVVE